MYMIEAIIKPTAMDSVIEALVSEGIVGVTATECKGFGKQKGHTQRYRGGTMNVGFVPKILLKVAVADEDRQKAIDAIKHAAHTGEVGDGKLFVYPLEQVVRIRTGETDHAAI